MFSPTDFEKKIYDFVTQQVNDVFLALLTKNEVQKEGIKIQRQILEALHDVAEETNAQISYGLMIGKPPVKTFRHGAHLFETVASEESSILLVCKNCKKAVIHNYAKDGQDFVSAISKFGKKCEPIKL